MKHTGFQHQRNPFAVDPIKFYSGSQRSRNGNVGLKDATASRLILPHKS